MITCPLNITISSQDITGRVELVKLDDKYYLEEFDNSDYIVELSIALAKENNALKERIQILEDQLHLTEKGFFRKTMA